MSIKTIAIKLVLLFIIQFSHAQESNYWVYLACPTNDQNPIELLSKHEGIAVMGYSAWLHALAVTSSIDLILELQNHPEITKIEEQGYFTTQKSKNSDNILGFALEQMGADELVKQGYNGKGIAVGIIDGGFLDADKDPSLLCIFEDGRVLRYRDYITPDLEAYSGSKGLDDRHGTDVMQLIGGLNTKTKVQHGLASGAAFYLARTDHGASEKKIEEYYLIKALEWMDSLGVRLVNISLGYTTGFDPPSDNYKPTQMDGSSAVAQAVQIAFFEKNMLVVVSAGNDGDKDWKVVSTPADARSALTVGATKLPNWAKANFSSIGPDYLPFAKPDVAVFAGQGTSFSAPIITGLAAIIWQMQPSLTNQQVRNLIVESGHLYPFSNNYVGSGVPNVDKILQLMAGEKLPTPVEVKEYSNVHRLGQKAENHVVLYHKSDNFRVQKEEYITAKNQKARIVRDGNAQHTTVVVDNKLLYEIRWMTAN